MTRTLTITKLTSACNILNHQYPNINHGTIWKTIESEIPILIRESELLLSEDP